MRPRPLSNPPNPFHATEIDYLGEPPEVPVGFYEDASRTIVAQNDSPDIGFRFSVNPYRGCQHACAYCYARPGHEYLGFGAGTDFDTRIAVKMQAPELLREAFEKPSWKGELLMFSGVTDCYQPVEASLRLTRGCLEVCAEYRQPIGIITKAPLVERDIDVLQKLNRVTSARVMVSIPFWNKDKARLVEPFVATPQRRIETIKRLNEAGIPTGVMVAPIIPGLNDEDMVRVLEAAREAGAREAGWVLVRLPGPVKQVFEERMRAAFPDMAEKILHRVRETRDGKMYQTGWGTRQTGTGLYAETIARLFSTTVKRLDFPGMPSAREDTFQRPKKQTPQLSLF
ncbi:MAG: PA0069 family radical SAM protein [Deltaproteobacteria bacterium]|nr:PA0069 family radical SAM protein [Deltaproteobacteria bacterium]